MVRIGILSILLFYMTGVMIASIPLSPLVSQPAPTANSTPAHARSLFIEDTCSPPCWFGLIPGESTSADVVNLIETSEVFGTWDFNRYSVFDEPHGNMIEGQYYLHWNGRLFEREDFMNSRSPKGMKMGRRVVRDSTSRSEFWDCESAEKVDWRTSSAPQEVAPVR
jgi:hypothetical protein